MTPGCGQFGPPWLLIGRIYVEYHQTLIHTKTQALGLVVSDKEII